MPTVIWDRGGVYVCEQFDASVSPDVHSLGHLSKRLPSMFKTKGWGIDISTSLGLHVQVRVRLSVIFEMQDIQIRCRHGMSSRG